MKEIAVKPAVHHDGPRALRKPFLHFSSDFYDCSQLRWLALGPTLELQLSHAPRVSTLPNENCVINILLRCLDCE